MGNIELVGVVNVTPDSFSDGGKHYEEIAAVQHATRLFEHGASKVDIGGESTRPGATPLHPDEEWSRIAGTLNQLIPAHGESVSVDTYHPEIVRRALQFGNFIVNDVTGFASKEMQELVSEHQLPVIVSHLPQSAGQDIQQAHQKKEIDSVEQVVDELLFRANELTAAGLHKSLITLDPGIGFGKTMKTNWELLRFGSKVPGYPVMIGHSNKRFLKTSIADGSPLSLREDHKEEMRKFMDDRNCLAAELAIAGGAKYLRVHDPLLYRDLA